MGQEKSMTAIQIRDAIRGFIQSNFLFGDASKMPSDDESLMSKGIIDSTGILELIEFVERKFQVVVEEQETTPQNLDSIDNVVRFIEGK
jgi:acyl carrier protein